MNAALRDAVNRRKRQAFFGRLAAGGLPDLTGPLGPAAEPVAAGQAAEAVAKNAADPSVAEPVAGAPAGPRTEESTPVCRK